MNRAGGAVVRYHRHDFNLNDAEQVKALANTLETVPLPATLIDRLIEWSAERDRYKWLMARALVQHLDQLPAALRVIARPIVIRRVAPLMKIEETTVREMVHTAEVIPVGWECDERLSMLGFSHWTRLARIGDLRLMQRVLDQIVAGTTEETPSITCAAIDRLNVSLQLVDEGRTPGEVETLLPILAPAKPMLSRLQATVSAIGSNGSSRKVIYLPVDDLQFAVGDTVIILRRSTSEE